MLKIKFGFIALIILAFTVFMTACSASAGNVQTDTTVDTTVSTEKGYTSPDGTVYLYELTLHGQLPNAACHSEIVIYTNDNTLTFDQVAESIYSSDYEISSLISEYYLVSIEAVS